MTTHEGQNCIRCGQPVPPVTKTGKWSTAEDSLALDDDLTTLQVAKMLGRSFASVEGRRAKLRNPDRIAAQRTRYQESHPWEMRTEEERSQRNARAVSANDEARSSAQKHYQPWTGPELELAADTSRTAHEVADAIGRTIWAVKTMRRQIKADPRKARPAGTDTPEARKATP